MAKYAISDFHGRLDLFKQVQEFLGPEDKLTIIGDVFDRGKDGLAIYREIQKDNRMTLLSGNHEMLAAKGLAEWLKWGCGGYDFSLWVDYNGGDKTFDAICDEVNIKSLLSIQNGPEPAAEKAIQKLVDELDALPVEEEYVNQDGWRIMLNHSGCPRSPWKDDLIWDRKHLFEEHWIGDNETLIVHGHTPIPLMIQDFKKRGLFTMECKTYEDGAFWYCESHKVCLDTGAFWTGQIVMLDLDNFDEHIFEGEKLNG